VNIGQFVDAAAQGASARLALAVGGRECTYGELHRAVMQVAATLRSHGIKRGDRVAVVDVGSVLSVAAILGAARIGAAAALMNVQLKPSELVELVRTAGCAPVGIAGDAYADALSQALPAGVIRERDLRDPQDVEVEGADDDAAMIIFTSGTTGLPKAVSISQGVLSRRTLSYAPPFKADARPAVSMMCVPIFHVGGSLAVLGSLYSGSTVVIQPRFRADEWLRLVQRYRVQSTFLVPTMIQRILDHSDFAATDLKSLASIAYGAAPAPPELVRRAVEALPHVGFLQLFGQTETLGGYAMLMPQEHRDPKRVGSVGKVQPGVELRIVDPLSQEDVPQGGVGEIWVRSQQNVREGWLRTGDLARVDADGYIFPAGRLADTINRGGEKFGPIEIETVLLTNPDVMDVGAAAIPDPEMGERVGVAVVTRRPMTSQQVKEYCREHLAIYKVPERVVFVDDLPYSETGKVNRKKLAELIVSKGGD
jgi:acyl-CoA synthetase (AMP-forming)/AMP-acid ligase II